MHLTPKLSIICYIVFVRLKLQTFFGRKEKLPILKSGVYNTCKYAYFTRIWHDTLHIQSCNILHLYLNILFLFFTQTRTVHEQVSCILITNVRLNLDKCVNRMIRRQICQLRVIFTETNLHVA